MDSSTLRRLGDGGFAAVGAEQLADLGAWCQDWCENTGDARYCVLSEVLRTINAWWDEQGVPSELLRRVETALTSYLPAILNADSESGSLLAVRLRDEVGSHLLSTDEWVKQGYVSRGSVHPAQPTEPD